MTHFYPALRARLFSEGLWRLPSRQCPRMSLLTGAASAPPAPLVPPFRVSCPAHPRRRLPRAPWHRFPSPLTSGSSPSRPDAHDPGAPRTPGRVICELFRRIVPAGHGGMGLSPTAGGEYGIRLSKIPWPRPKFTSKTSSTESSDTQPATGPSTVSHSESARSQALLVQLLPKRFKQGCRLEQARSLPRGEKPVIDLEITPSKNRTELTATPKLEIEGNLKNQAAENKPRPRPGDLIEIFRIGYEHWAIYVEDDCVVHLAPPSEEFEVGSITSIFSNRAVVKYSRLEDVLHGCSWKINNKLDGIYLPLPVDKIMQRTRNMINKIVQYSLIEGNCEHFVNDLRYGVPRSQQVEHALVEGAKAAGAVISAVMDSIRPKPMSA
ncbi:phospholipase A and acyltransferase 5 [Phodopus roborovskii]|uniref:phospholipase A and acyltransferase 5 n=1 Tax=Phodopus roborovskii TaxID=109678 RepID=UPI0021E3C157|nr:phospholipase A and acyltransferase 5 [Phodopus roborovskii]